MNGWVSILNTTVKESYSPKQVSKHMVKNRKSANSKLRLKRLI